MRFKIDIPESWDIRDTLKFSPDFLAENLFSVDNDDLSGIAFTREEIQKNISNISNIFEDSQVFLVATFTDLDHSEIHEIDQAINFMCSVYATWLPLDEMPEGLKEPSALAVTSMLLGGNGAEFGENSIVNPKQLLFEPTYFEITGQPTIRLQWSDQMSSGSTNSADQIKSSLIHDMYLIEPPEEVMGLVLLQFSCPMPWAMEAFFEISSSIAHTIAIDPEQVTGA